MKELWKYYVPIPGIDNIGKPIVVEGGRGSGKTMLFQCNSWRENLARIKKEQKRSNAIYNDFPFIGIYYRVDTTFVSSMIGKRRDDWHSIFETYISICILQEILDLSIELNKDNLFNNIRLKEFVEKYSKKLCPTSGLDNLIDFRSEIEIYLDQIEDMINGRKQSQELRFVKAHRFITDLCSDCSRLFEKEDILYKIFIDEYETLQEYQQEIVNTFIKHSSLPVIFNIGLRPQGFKTHRTISETETIESPHDYEELSLRIEDKKYETILKQICEKRIELGKDLGEIPETASTDIEYYLKNYTVKTEVKYIIDSKIEPKFLKELPELIENRGREEGLNDELIEKYKKGLYEDVDILTKRIHYVILNVKTRYTPKIEDLYNGYETKSDVYKEWIHNRKNGAIFLLAKDFQKEKMYFGFNTYSALSSNVVRYFLELCEQAFRIAFLDNDYRWDKTIDPKIQTDAAKYVSNYKIIDIAGYEPHGKELRIFAQYLGQLFHRLHTNPKTTLGEPEQNHFSTTDLTLTNNTKTLLDYAIMCNVLQMREPTKKKNSTSSPETVDYYLNRIYSPHFEISYRSQRKIKIDVDLLEKMLSGDSNIAKTASDECYKIVTGQIQSIKEYKTRSFEEFEE